MRISASIGSTGIPAMPNPPIRTVDPSVIPATAWSGSVHRTAVTTGGPSLRRFVPFLGLPGVVDHPRLRIDHPDRQPRQTGDELLQPLVVHPNRAAIGCIDFRRPSSAGS